MGDHRTPDELTAENEALYAELEDIAERIGELLEDSTEEEDGDDGDAFPDVDDS